MHIDIKNNLNDRLEFEASKLLRKHKETNFHNANYRLRHPFAIYNVSINAVLVAFKNLLEAVSSVQKDQSTRELSNKELNRNLIVSTDQWLDSIMEHLDDCLNIIKTLFPSEEDKHYKKACRSFNQSIRIFRDHIAKQVNCIKHSQARIRLIGFYDHSVSVPGYYIEGILADGTIGPHPDIHKGSNTAFSYYRELRYVFCGLTFVSEQLRDAIKKLLPVGSTSEDNSDKDKLSEIIDSIVDLPFMFFPDEYSKPIPLITQSGDKRIIRYPSQVSKPQKLPAHLRIKTEFQGDGVSKSFKLPYFGQDMK